MQLHTRRTKTTSAFLLGIRHRIHQIADKEWCYPQNIKSATIGCMVAVQVLSQGVPASLDVGDRWLTWGLELLEYRAEVALARLAACWLSSCMAVWLPLLPSSAATPAEVSCEEAALCAFLMVVYVPEVLVVLL